MNTLFLAIAVGYQIAPAGPPFVVEHAILCVEGRVLSGCLSAIAGVRKRAVLGSKPLTDFTVLLNGRECFVFSQRRRYGIAPTATKVTLPANGSVHQSKLVVNVRLASAFAAGRDGPVLTSLGAVIPGSLLDALEISERWRALHLPKAELALQNYRVDFESSDILLYVAHLAKGEIPHPDSGTSLGFSSRMKIDLKHRSVISESAG